MSRDAALTVGILAHFERDHSCDSMRISGMELCIRMFNTIVFGPGGDDDVDGENNENGGNDENVENDPV